VLLNQRSSPGRVAGGASSDVVGGSAVEMDNVIRPRPIFQSGEVMRRIGKEILP